MVNSFECLLPYTVLDWFISLENLYITLKLILLQGDPQRMRLQRDDYTEFILSVFFYLRSPANRNLFSFFAKSFKLAIR